MAKERDIIKKKLQLYDEGDNEFIDSLDSVQNSLFREVISLLQDFRIPGGDLFTDEGYLLLLNGLNAKLEKILKDSQLENKVDKYMRNFDEMDKLNQQLHKAVNNIKLTKVNLNPVKTQAIKDLSRKMIAPDSITVGIIQPIKDIMFQSIATGMKYKDARQLLEDFIKGNAKRQGHMKRWAGQLARDALNQYDGLVNDIIAKEYGLNAYRYVGSLINDSRHQCVRWVNEKGGVLPFDELQSEINWAFKNGSGMIPGTVPDNFATFRGGYNCRHMAIPFRLEENNK